MSHSSSTGVSHTSSQSTFFSHNYFRCSSKIYKIKMGSCEKSCLIFLFQYQNLEHIFPSLPLLIAGIEANKRTVLKALKNLEEVFKFIDVRRVKGMSNTYTINYDNIEDAYQEAVVQEKRSRIKLVEPGVNLPLVSKKEDVTRCKSAPTSSSKSAPTTRCKNAPTPGANLHPYNVLNNNYKNYYVYNAPEGAEGTHKQDLKDIKKEEEKPKASAVYMAKKARGIVYEDGKPAKFLEPHLFSTLEVDHSSFTDLIECGIERRFRIEFNDVQSADKMKTKIIELYYFLTNEQPQQ
jgi:hypothetical protein